MSPTKSTFLGKKFGGTRHPCDKNDPTLDHSGGGGCTVMPAGSCVLSVCNMT